jgi:hypothetical protein
MKQRRKNVALRVPTKRVEDKIKNGKLCVTN